MVKIIEDRPEVTANEAYKLFKKFFRKVEPLYKELEQKNPMMKRATGFVIFFFNTKTRMTQIAVCGDVDWSHVLKLGLEKINELRTLKGKSPFVFSSE